MIQVVKKFELNEVAPVVKTLSHEEFNHLKSNINQQKAQETLKEIYTAKHWLLCNCKYKSPTYIKKIKATSRYILSRVPYRKEHETNCHFYRLDDLNKPVTAGVIVQPQKPNKPIFNSYNFSYEFEYRKSFFKTNNTIKRISRIDIDDPFYTFVNTLMGTGRIELGKVKSNQAISDIELRSTRFMLNKKSSYDLLALNLTEAYQNIKKKLSDKIMSGEDKLPTGLVISHINGLSIESNGQAALTVFKSKKTDGNDFKITLPRNTAITSLSTNVTTGPLIAAIIVGKTGKNERDKTPYIGPLHVLLMTALDYNNFYAIAGPFSRAFLRTLYSEKKERSALANTDILSAYFYNEIEYVDALINGKRLLIAFSDTSPFEANSAINLWFNNSNLSISEARQYNIRLIDILSGSKHTNTDGNRITSAHR